MKISTTCIAIIAIAFGVIACSHRFIDHAGDWGSKTIKGSKNYVTKDIRVDNFNAISVAGSPNVVYTQKPGSSKVEVYTSDNIVDLLDIQVKDKTLIIQFKKGVNVSYDKLEVKVNSPELNGISVAGSGNFEFANGLKTNKEVSINVAGSGNIKGKNINCNDMSISIAGSGNINIESIQCKNLKSSVAGSGNMKMKDVTASNVESSVAGSGNTTLRGTAQEASFSIAGSGNLSADELEVKRVNSSISGSGKIKCFATDFLKVRSSGSGSVGYKGNPQLDVPKKGFYKL